jgi:hypothetical protein
MRNPDTPWRRALLIEGRIKEETTYSAVRTVGSVYVEYRSPEFGKEFEFYDLVSDPHQLSMLFLLRPRTSFNLYLSVFVTASEGNAGYLRGMTPLV